MFTTVVLTATITFCAALGLSNQERIAQGIFIAPPACNEGGLEKFSTRAAMPCSKHRITDFEPKVVDCEPRTTFMDLLLGQVIFCNTAGQQIGAWIRHSVEMERWHCQWPRKTSLRGAELYLVSARCSADEKHCRQERRHVLASSHATFILTGSQQSAELQSRCLHHALHFVDPNRRA